MEWSDEMMQAWLDDEEKRVAAPIKWSNRNKSGTSVHFREVLETSSDIPMTIKGFYNPTTQNLNFAVIAPAPINRIYSLDLGPREHKDPSKKEKVRGMHKHRYTSQYGIASTYVPDDITATWDEVQKGWREFIQEAKIKYDGDIPEPVMGEEQGELFP